MNTPKGNTNLQYIINYTCEYSNCHCDEDICRCIEILSTTIISIPIQEVIEELFMGKDTGNEIDHYCFDRLCRIAHIYDENYYNIDVVSGYYGEEVSCVEFVNENIVNDHYNHILQLPTDIEKLQYVLKLEYGYLLEPIKNATSANIAICNSSNVVFPQECYSNRLSDDVVDSYKDYQLPCAICTKVINKFKIIDGYHRVTAHKNNPSMKIILIE